MSWELALADAFDYLETIPDGSVDAFISDLPYGTTQLTWDKAPDLERLWPLIYRKCKPSAVQVMFSAQPFTTDLINSNRKRFRYAMVWPKTTASGHLNAGRRPLLAHEDVLTFSAIGTTTYNPQMQSGGKPYRAVRGADSRHYGSQTAGTITVSTGNRHPTTLTPEYPGAVSGSMHPTQKPLELLCYLVKTYSQPGDLVVDPFSGSGTTGAACILTGRRFMGCEIDEKYHAAANRRLEATAAQTQLFEVQT